MYVVVKQHNFKYSSIPSVPNEAKPSKHLVSCCHIFPCR